MPRQPITFNSAKQVRIFQDVVDQIQDAILNGSLKPGDTLPSERELKNQFNTSRGTLREALRVLEQKGLIKIQLGVNGGAIVQSPKVDSVLENLDFLIRFQKISLFHLAEFRENAEGFAAALAARRATDAQIQKLDALIQEADQIVQTGLSKANEFIRVDGKIHQEIASISGNPIYMIVHRIVHENIQKYYEDYLPWTIERMEKNFNDLKSLVQAIKQKNETTAKSIAEDHVRQFNVMMTQQYESSSQNFFQSI